MSVRVVKEEIRVEGDAPKTTLLENACEILDSAEIELHLSGHQLATLVAALTLALRKSEDFSPKARDTAISMAVQFNDIAYRMYCALEEKVKIVEPSGSAH